MGAVAQARKRNVAGFGRVYEIPDQDGLMFPSVTTFLSVVGKPALVNWAANTERQLCIEAAANLWEDAPHDPPMSRMAYVTTLTDRIGKTKAHVKELAKASDIGTQAHAFIEWKIKLMMGVISPEPTIGQEAMWAVMAWEDWAKASKFRPIFVEQVVYSLEDRFAGTLDLYAEIEHDGKAAGCCDTVGRVLVVADWKTGKGIYAEASLQNAAYRKALIEMGHHDPAIALHGAIIRLPKTATDPEFEVKFLHEADLQEKHYPAFVNTMALWRWNKQQEDERRQ